MRSMTGYGKSKFTSNDYELNVEIKAVNNRYLDVNFRTPKGFSPLEEGMRNAIKQNILRGRVDVFINFTDNRQIERKINVDVPLAAAYMDAAKEISNATGLDIGTINLGEILKFPDIVKSYDDLDRGFLEETLIKVLLDAISSLNQMRDREGQKLMSDMLLRVGEIEKNVELLKDYAPQILQSYKLKLTQRVAEFLKDATIDEDRILNEVAIFSDRASIDEEIDRLKSHINQFKKISLEKGCGKKLDFLLQEFNREANTICSKSSDVKISDYGLNIKGEIEKIREQVQNIE